METLRLGNSPISDDGFRHLAAFPHLWRIELAGSPIGDAGLAHVGRVAGAQYLSLWDCKNLTSNGLVHLAKLSILRNLRLVNTAIDDKAVSHLAQISSLRVLRLEGTKVSAAGIDELKRALPKCAILWDGGVVIPAARTANADSK